jgi:four helix bundle protein
MSENVIQKKSFEFSIQIVETYKLLIAEKREFVLSKQLLRSGTSIGANVSEAIHGQSNKDFIHKLQISRKEASETLYWLNLLHATDYLSTEKSNLLTQSCHELLKILTSIIKTMENKLR